MKKDKIESIPIKAIRVFSKNDQVFKQEGTGDWRITPFKWTTVILE